MGTLIGFPYPPALWLRRGKPASANATVAAAIGRSRRIAIASLVLASSVASCAPQIGGGAPEDPGSGAPAPSAAVPSGPRVPGSDAGASPADADGPSASRAAPAPAGLHDAGASTGGADLPPPSTSPASPILPVVFFDVPGVTADQMSTAPPTLSYEREGRMKVFVEHDGTLKNPTAIKAGVPVLETAIGIEKRGSSSAGFPQISFSVELHDGNKMEIESPLLGMPSQSDWAFVACWNDKTCMRHALAYEMGRAMGRWHPRVRFVEVFFNDSYRGLYMLTEPVRQDKNRIDLPKPAPDATAGAEALSGGYIFRREAGGKGTPTTNPPRDWLSPTKDPSGRYQIVYTYRYPHERSLTAAQRDYLKRHVAAFEEAMRGPDWADAQRGYRAWIDSETFAEFALINEASANVDGYWKSMYLVKPRDQAGARGKLLATPFWDFNIAFGNADYRDGWRIDGWASRLNRFVGECTAFLPPPAGCAACNWNDAKCSNMPYVPFWWERLWSDGGFQNQLKCVWQKHRKAGQAFSMELVDRALEGWRAQLRPNVARHYKRWPDLRKKVWPNPCEFDAAANAFRANTKFKLAGLPDPNCGQPTLSAEAFLDFEVKWLRDWTQARLAWLDKNLPGTCSP